MSFEHDDADIGAGRAPGRQNEAEGKSEGAGHDASAAGIPVLEFDGRSCSPFLLWNNRQLVDNGCDAGRRRRRAPGFFALEPRMHTAAEDYPAAERVHVHAPYVGFPGAQDCHFDHRAEITDGRVRLYGGCLVQCLAGRLRDVRICGLEFRDGTNREVVDHCGHPAHAHRDSLRGCSLEAGVHAAS